MRAALPPHAHHVSYQLRHCRKDRTTEPMTCLRSRWSTKPRRTINFPRDVTPPRVYPRHICQEAPRGIQHLSPPRFPILYTAIWILEDNICSDTSLNHMEQPSELFRNTCMQICVSPNKLFVMCSLKHHLMGGEALRSIHRKPQAQSFDCNNKTSNGHLPRTVTHTCIHGAQLAS